MPLFNPRVPAPFPGAPLFPFVVEPWQLQTGEIRPDRVLDLRVPERFARGHLAGAVCVPYNDFQERAEELVGPGETALVVDPGGARAAEMATWLRARGVQAGYLQGGMAAWLGPLERGP